ncbi:MAG: hypothetical protein WKF47_14025 [Geodermatophilaceae bacterium]
MHLQAPPNLDRRLRRRCSTAGIDDWGGVSPVTADHVNPERPWPDLDRLRDGRPRAPGSRLAPRLTDLPRVRPGPGALARRRRCASRCSTAPTPSASAATTPARSCPEQHRGTRDTRRRRRGGPRSGDRSTAWYSGRRPPPPVLLPRRRAVPDRRGRSPRCSPASEPARSSAIDELVTLFAARGPRSTAVAELADELRAEAVGDTVTCVRNRNINYTNVCTFKCTFCGFSKGPLSLEPARQALPARPSTRSPTAPREAWRPRRHRGLACRAASTPSFDGDYYIDVCRAVTPRRRPDIHIHGFTALEVTEGAKRLGEPLDRLPAPAAWTPACARCPARRRRSSTTRSGPSSARTRSTPTSGSTPTATAHARRPALQRHDHVRLRRAAACTGPGTSLRTRDAADARPAASPSSSPLPFVHMAAPIYLQRQARRGPTFREAVLMHAVGRDRLPRH